MKPHLELEQALRIKGHSRIAGIDEAGRGALAGPVVVGAVVLPEDFAHAELNDSKLLRPERREVIFEELIATPGLFWTWARIEAKEIDRINILAATHLGMCQVFAKLDPPAEIALVDGLSGRGMKFPHQAVVKGDSKSLSIAAASIVAKVLRDRLMRDYDREFPNYGFATHKGYGTAHHLQQLNQYGPCSIHRQTFAPVAQGTLPLAF